MIWDNKFKIKNTFCDVLGYIPAQMDWLTLNFLRFSSSTWKNPDPKYFPFNKGVYLQSDRICIQSWDRCKDIKFEDVR